MSMIRQVEFKMTNGSYYYHGDDIPELGEGAVDLVPLRHLRVEKLVFRSPHFAKRGWALLVASMAYLKEVAYIET
jgi:hypothetical protein